MPMTQADMDLLTERIEQQYRGNLLLDNFPVVEYSPTPVSIGYPLGVPAKKGLCGGVRMGQGTELESIQEACFSLQPKLFTSSVLGSFRY
jgi:hypothetical protein